MAEWPPFVTDRKWCGCCAALMASTAIRTLPSVPFLKPTGQERPDASSRWTWLSVVRAPIAPQDTRSAMYCGVIMSRYSQPAGRPSSFDVEEQLAREPEPAVDVEVAVERRIVDEPLPADGRARLLEVDAHHHLELGRVAVAARATSRRAYSRAADGSWIEQGPDHDDQPVVHPVQDAVDRLAGAGHGRGGLVGAGELADEVRRRRELV